MPLFKGKSIAEIHHSMISGVGLVYAMQAGEWAWNVARDTALLEAPAANILPASLLALSCLLPLILGCRPVMPNAVKAPSRWLHLPILLLALYLFSASGQFLISYQGIAAGMAPEQITQVHMRILSSFGIFFFVASVVTGIKSILSGGGDGNIPAPADRITRQARGRPSDDAFVVLSIHRALLALGGVAMITFGVAIHLTSQRDPQVAALYAATDLFSYAMVSAGLCVAIGLSFLTTRTLPRFVHRPTRWFHFPAIGFYISAVSLAALAPLLVMAPPALTSILEGQSPGVFTRYDLVQAGSTTTIISAVSFLGLIATTIAVIARKPPAATSPDALRPYPSQRASDLPEVAPKKNMNKGKLPEPKLPSIGAAMKLYVIADWLMMRLLGLGLLGTAWILWQLIEGGRDYQAFQISYGQNPMHALYAYAGVGTLMTVPYLLPRFITAPRHVIGGLLKAVLLAATAFILLPMLHVGIEMFTPDMYWATLHATAPGVFKALAGVAVTSALLISFFRQLGNVPQVDYTGKPVLVLSQQELRSLRAARAED
ncbi:hypothetical protein [Jannaschia sp. 2305UL9-9]|uniref:hypothetical protein n=1 Tax=Jannaschia sp. 2305UL9-9 TaxID=3121638 RepID=UPI0035277F46